MSFTATPSRRPSISQDVDAPTPPVLGRGPYPNNKKQQYAASFNGAVDRIRTGDLILGKDAL